MNAKRRGIAMLLAILMCFSMLPTSLAADETQTDSETAENLVVTFETDEHTTVDLYYTKDDYSQANETDVTSAYVRGKGSTEIDYSGEGQVNFKVNADEGYEYDIAVTPTDGYNNCKGEEETGVADIWRITKISSDLTVTITSAAESSEGEDTESGEASATAATILYTNDVHTYIDEDITYSLAAGYRDTLENVLLVDAGDHVQGTAYGGMDNGQTIIELMNAAGYDLATLGNHEFDYGMDGAMNAIEWADFPYVSCNFYHESNGVAGDLVLDAYKVFEVNGISIAFVGITTPESFTKSTPKYFQDDDGNYIYGIAGGEDGEELYEYVQKAIDAAAEEADYVIALGHLGDAASSSPWTSEEVIANTTGLDAFIDGHSHSTVEMKTIADKDGNAVVLTQTGSYFKALGQMTISEDGTITTELLDADDLADVEKNAEVEAIEEAWIADVDEQLGEKIAETDIDFTVYYEDTGSRAVRKSETNMGDLNADAYYWYINEKEGLDCDLAVMNGGGVRASIDAGDWTYLSCKTVNTFGNVLCVVEVSGQAILDALEFGARFTPDAECGGFLQIAGASYEIDTSIANTVQVDDKSIWTGAPTGDYRVTNVKIYNKETGEYEALELDKTYTIAGTNYTLRDCGDGFDMFGDSVLVKDYITEDYLALAAYLQSFADSDGNGYADVSTENSPLATYEGYLLDYESSTGAGRITNITGADKWVPTDLVVNIGATEDSISVVWYDTSADAGTLTFGGTDYTASVSAAQREGYYVNRVTLSGLTAETDYEYTITSGDGETSETYTYTTAAFGDGEEFSFAIVGDPQIGAGGNATSDTEGWAAAVEAMLADGTAYSFLFSMGDQVNSYYKADASNSADVESEYDGYLSAAGLSGIAMATIVGNHDAGGNTTAYSDHFAMPNVSDYGKALNDNYSAGYLGDAAATVDSDGAADYYFTYNGVLFMVLNSSNESIAEHKEFMEKTIEANPDVNWTVVAFHKSIYSVASHVTESDIETLRNGLSPIFADLGIDIVLQGHDHVYARSYVMGGTTGMEAQDTESGAQSDIYNADGVVYVTFNSASGSKYYNITNEAFTYTAVMNQEKVQNYSTATVTEDSFTVTTYRVTDGSVVDTFTLHKGDEAEWTPTDLVVNIGATEDSISVVWYDTSADAGTLTFGGTDYTASVSAAQREGYYVNRVTLSGLTAETDYRYTITSGDGETSETYTYATAAFGDGEEFSFAIVGDPQIGASGNATSDTEGWAAAVEAMLADDTSYSFLFSMGDQVNSYYKADASNSAAVESEYDGYLSAAGLSGIAMATIVGNHDAGGNTTAYSDHFAMPNVSDYGKALNDNYSAGYLGDAAATVDSDGAADYYFTYNGVLFMVLNSSNESIAEHKEFMEKTIEANPDVNWTVVAFHKSIYSVASHVTESDIETLRNGLSPIFADLGIDIVLQGHDHVYARSYVMGGTTGMEAQDTESGAQSDIYNADGVVYVTFNSASGSKYYNITNEAFTYTAVMNQEKVQNYSAATVTEDSFTVTTYRVTDGSVVDTFTLHKGDETEWTPTDLVVNIGATEDSISVVWYDTSADAGTLAFGGKEYTAGISAASREGYYINRVSVTDLQPSTDYTYTITSGDGETSQIYTYTTTAFGEGKTFSFAIVGDPQIGASGNADSDTEGWNTAVNTILSNGTAYSFLFSMGDQVNAYYGESSEYAGYSAALTAAIEAYDESTDGEYIAYLVTALGMSGTGYEEYITNALQSVELAQDATDVALILKTMGISGNNGDDVEAEYDGYLSPTGLSGIAMATIVGNHDAGNDNSALYTNHYSMPNVTEYGENQEGDGDYYFTYNGVLFMVLNSSNLSIAEHKTFLEETLEANPDATWNVVAFHKSIYSVASHVTESDIEALRLGLAPIFVDLGIDIVLQGHDHVYARSYVMGGANGMTALDTESGAQSDIYNADGVVYVTFNSASGSKFYNITNEAFTYTSVMNQEKVANYSTATVTEDSFTVTTYRVTDGSVVDTFTLHKNDEQSESVTPPEGDVKIAVISDDHLYDTTLGDSGSAFEAYLAGDRKLLAESEAILDSALATIAESGVDYLLISGDLTKDGERQNHELLAEKLAAFEAETGISVFVTNGNHDISNSNAVSFDGDTTTRVETIDTDDFRTIYADFGYSEAVAVDTNSLSYAVNLGDDYRLIVIDSCKYNDDKDNPSQETGGEIDDATMTWVLAQIKAAVKDGRRPIGMMHHGLVSHTDIEPEMFSEYLVDDYETVAATLADAGLNLVFTGHFHSQDVAVTTTASGSTLYDVETGSLVTSPCPIRYVSLTGSTFSYITDHVTEAEGIDNFAEYADEFLMNGLLGLTAGYKAISVTLYGTTYTADELLAEGFAAHYAGAEQIDYKTQKIITACAEAAAATDNETMVYYYNLLAWALTALYTDSEGDDLEAAALTLTALPSYSSGSSGSGSGHAGSSTSTSTTTTTTTTDTTADAEITAEDVKAALSIEVSDSTVETLLGLTDVALDGYYYDALAWAVENGVTTGTSDTTFSPNIGCTRAQVVTFLYRAAGSPAVEGGADSAFTDADSEAYYYNAMLWAVQQGITLGTSETTFSTDDVCTRAQIVTFLYRAAGSPEVDDSADSAFTDVSSSAYYCNAVLWAAQQGITLGTSETTFSPDDDCTRAQIVTFMFRYMA